MIYLLLQGGLGNQFFQYAAARKVSLETNQNIIGLLKFFETDHLRELSTRLHS